MSKDIQGNDWFGCFFLKADPLVSLLFSRNIDDRLINLFRVSRKNSYSNVSVSVEWSVLLEECAVGRKEM